MINPNALDTALNLIGAHLSVPLNNMVFSLTNALDAAEKRGFEQGHEIGYQLASGDGGPQYTNGYVQGFSEAEAETEQVATESYDDGYIDAVHDYGLSPQGAVARAMEIEEERSLAAANRSFDAEVDALNYVALCDDPDCVVCNPIFPVDAEYLP